MSAHDPFALGGRQDNDGEILALFREWLAQSRIADEKEDGDPGWDEALDRRDEIEDQIVALRAGPIGLAVKAFLHYRIEAATWTPSLAGVRGDTLFEPGCMGPGPGERLMVSILRDAAALVPEIGECAAAIIHEDAVLIDADMTVQWVALVLRDQDGKKLPAWRADVDKRLRRALDRIASTPAKTPRGQAIKGRLARQVAPG
jgi:hypothetical protein